MSAPCPTSIKRTAETCPACDAGDRDVYGEKNNCLIYRCRSCRTLYAECSTISYDGYYDDANLTVPEFIQQRLDDVFASLKTYRKTNRLLDIGCGAGSLIEAARRAGWDAEGLEVSGPAAMHVGSLGFKVFHGDLSQANYPADYFDVVTASELVEHLADPFGMLEEVARILRPGGLLWATTPNAGGLSARMLGIGWSIVCPPEHLQLFSIDGIRQMIARAGFQRIRVNSRGCNPFEIWHAVRHGKNQIPEMANNGRRSTRPADGAAKDEEMPTAQFDRVKSSYHLNEMMLRNPLTRAIKRTANAALGVTRLGDTIRVQAEK
jgi:SAM-dependent methyltransferase